MVIPMRPKYIREVPQACSRERILAAVEFFSNGQAPMQQRHGFRIIALALIQHSEVAQLRRYIWIVRTRNPFSNL